MKIVSIIILFLTLVTNHYQSNGSFYYGSNPFPGLTNALDNSFEKGIFNRMPKNTQANISLFAEKSIQKNFIIEPLVTNFLDMHPTAATYDSYPVWSGMRPATCMPDHCFCEIVTNGFVRQPINTWSNLAFIVSGATILIFTTINSQRRQSYIKANNLMGSDWSYPFIYGFSSILIGLGSMFYHASMSFYGQVIDVISMYLLTIFVTIYNLSRLKKINKNSFLLLFFGSNIILGYFSIVYPGFRRHIFIGILVLTLITELIARIKINSRMNLKLFFTALVSLLIGCFAWVMDITATICLPSSWIQLHAVWHVSMAVAILFLYFYYRSEQLDKVLIVKAY